MEKNTSCNFTKRTDNVQRLLADLRTLKPLSPEEECELGFRIKLDDTAALNKLVEHNLLFAFSVAKQYTNCGLDFEDVFSAACNGVIRAAKSFDPTKGCKFITHAKNWIIKEIMDALAEESRNVRVPANQQDNMRKINKISERFYQKNGYYPTSSMLEDLVAGELALSSEQIATLLSLSDREKSIDKNNSQDEDGEIYNPDLNKISLGSAYYAPDKMLLEDDYKSYVCDFCKKNLNERELRIVIDMYGFNGDTKSVDSIAMELGITSDRVHQIHRAAIKKLRRHSTSFEFEVA